MGFSSFVGRGRKDDYSKREERDRQNYINTLNEISMLKEKLAILELDIKQSEFKIPKVFPKVTFLNYKERKRILVSEIGPSLCF